MTTVPNLRNGGSNSTGPTLWSTDTHEYTVTFGGASDPTTGDFSSIIIGKRALADAWDEWETYDLADIGEPVTTWLSVMQGDPDDDHYRPAIAHHASTGRTYVARPLHGEELQILRSDPNVINSWTEVASVGADFPTLLDGISHSEGGTEPTVSYSQYPMFLPRPDGGLILLVTQADSEATPATGRDVIGFELEPGETEWAALGGCPNNEIAVVSDLDQDPPERAYHAGEVIGPDGTLHLFLLWHWDSNDNTTRFFATYLQRSPAGVWQDIDANAVTMPLTYDYANTNGLVLPDQITQYQAYWQAALDLDGYPHWRGRSTTNDETIHYWWDGSAWQHDLTDDRGMEVWINGRQWRYRGELNSSRPRLYDDGGSGATVVLGGQTTALFEPMPDPVRLQAGVFAVCVPDGDTPRTFTFGNHARMKAA